MGNKETNIIINGVGGQGLITLLKIIGEAAMIEKYDIKTSELHGISQRSGSVEVHIKFGKKIWSPMVSKGRADLVLSLESQESLNGLYYASKDTVFLINQYKTPTLIKDYSESEVLTEIKQTTKNVYLIPAAEICKKTLETDVVAGVYLLGIAAHKKYLGLKPESVITAIKKLMPEKYLELNIKAFNLAKDEK